GDDVDALTASARRRGRAGADRRRLARGRLGAFGMARTRYRRSAARGRSGGRSLRRRGGVLRHRPLAAVPPGGARGSRHQRPVLVPLHSPTTVRTLPRALLGRSSTSSTRTASCPRNRSVSPCLTRALTSSRSLPALSTSLAVSSVRPVWITW